MVKFGNDWDDILKDELKKEYYLKLRSFLISEYKNYKVYPDMCDIYNALRVTSFKDVKVVILGQDPYINEGEAHGLSFSVKEGIPIPPSLKNIYKEIVDDVGGYIPNNGYLMKWAEQGVLMLNATLTVRAKASKSHSGRGWETLTDYIITSLNHKEERVVFLLWGNDAKSKSRLITNNNHKILSAAHPSPLARGGFFGCKHFSKTNELLREQGLSEIDWQI